LNVVELKRKKKANGEYARLNFSLGKQINRTRMAGGVRNRREMKAWSFFVGKF